MQEAANGQVTLDRLEIEVLSTIYKRGATHYPGKDERISLHESYLLKALSALPRRSVRQAILKLFNRQLVDVQDGFILLTDAGREAAKAKVLGR